MKLAISHNQQTSKATMNQPAWYERFGQIGTRLSLVDRHYERGLYYFTKNKLDQAIADLDEAIQLQPKRAELYTARGLMLLQNSEPEKAEEDFAYALELDLQQWLSYYGRGIHAFENADYTQAIDFFSRAQLVAPDRPEVYYYRAIAFFQIDQKKEAQRDMRYSLSLLGEDDARRRDVQRWLKIFEK
jgi:Flp pilus assembly protein TadD